MRFFTFLLGLGLGIGLSLVCALNFPSIAFAESVTGKVTDEQGHSLANIRVSVYISSGSDPTMWYEDAWALTDATDVYTMSNVSVSALSTGGSGIERMRFADTVTPPRYASEYYNNAPTREEGTVISTGGRNIVTVNAQLALSAQIKGQVTDTAGQPASNITITAYRQVTIGGVARWVSVTGATSDNRGSYTVMALPGGAYRIGYRDDSGLRRYATVYYPNAASVETAADITLAAGGIVANINAQLAGRGSISGQVTNKRGQPVSGISLDLYTYTPAANGDNWGMPYSITQTDAAGRYTITGLDRGKYRIAFVDYYHPTDYLLQFYKDAPTLESATDIQIEPAILVNNINAQLAARGQLTGRISDKQGRPVQNYLVHAYSFDSGIKKWFQSTYGGPSDATGIYTITGLLPGVYHIGFFDDHEWPQRYLPQYYKNSPTIENGTDVLVQADAVTRGIDAQVAPTGQISGRATDEMGHPIDKLEVSIYYYVSSPGGGAWYPVPDYMFGARLTATDSTGAYAFSGLEPATYRLSFVDPLNRYLPEYYNNATRLDSATNISVSASAMITGIDVQLATVGRITGKVTDLNDQPLPNLTVVALRSDTGAQVAEGVTDSTGVYTITGLPQGVYRVLFNSVGQTSPTPYVPLYYPNATTLADGTDIQVRFGETVSNINAKLAARGRIAGKITNLAGAAVQNVRVTIYRQNPESGLWYPSLFALTDEQGDYEISGLAPAKYRVGFQDEEIFTGRRYVPEYYQHAFTLESATDIQVSLNQTVAMNAQLTPLSHITGTVTSEDGSPVVDVQVVVWRFKPEVNDWQNDGVAYLDEAGHYDFRGLKPDRYRIQFYSENTQCYRGEYYDNVLTLGEAKDILVGLNETVAGINAQLALSNPINQPVPRFTFHATVGIAGITPLCTAKSELKAPVNTPIVYCYTIQNTGDVTLTTHTLSDSHFGLLLNTAFRPLAPGQSYSTTFTQTLAVSTTNVATWTATTALPVSGAAQAQATSASTTATVIISSAMDDQDQDGIPDNVEGAADVDRDNVPNFLDLDADGDGLSDAGEAGPDLIHPRDSDLDGIPDFLEQSQLPSKQQVFLPLVVR